MEPPSPGTIDSLLQLARTSGHETGISIDSRGVKIELADLQLQFHHSFTSGPIAKRASQSNQLLLKACNNKQRNIHRVLDLTAGWGIDAYTLARHGQTVTLLEQNKLVHAILLQSLAQLASNSATADIAARMVIEQIDAKKFLHDQRESEFDCIYLDPMFPTHKSGAKPGKEMQILQALTDNSNIDDCFELALAQARKRVVVKRAAKAVPLGQRKPDLVHRAKTIRFDVYLTA